MAVTNVIGKQIINIDNDTNYYFVVAPQGDSQARFVDITLTTNGGAPYVIENGSTIILEGKNAGGYNIFSDCTQEDTNVIRVPLNNGVLSYAGVGKYLIGIYHGGDYILSFPFNIVVTEAPYDVVALQASDVYEALNEIIARAADSNRWIVDDEDPVIHSECPEGTHQNDYYLNAVTGDVFYAKFDTTTDKLTWEPLENTATGRQLNIMEKTYVRYALDSSGTGFSKNPVGKKYVGFYSSVNKEDDLDPSLDINDPSNYSWALFVNALDDDNTYCLYGVTDSDEDEPETWSSTIPSVVPGAYLWTKVHLTFYSGDTAEYKTVTKFGMGIKEMIVTKDPQGHVSGGEHGFKFVYDDVAETESEEIIFYDGLDAGFADNAATASINTTGGKSSVTVTETGGVTDKAFDLAFSLRGTEWKMGTAISGSGTQTSTDFDESNTLVGDMYLNKTSGKSYRCSAVTASNSTWEEGFTFGPITMIDDLNNTRRYYGVLAPGQDTATITGSDAMFTAADAAGTTYYYHVKFLTTSQMVTPNKYSVVNITDGAITATLLFTGVLVDSMKVTPAGTENPHDKGWYEEDDGAYVVTDDTTVDPNKDYYASVGICMEVIKKER